MPWSLLFGFLGNLPGAIGDYFKRKNDLALAKIDSDTKIEQARAQLAGEIAKAELEKATVTLGATGAWFKYCTFVMWFGPFVLGIFWPSKAHEVFVNLAAMPEWYVQSIIALMFTVWGIAVSAPVVSNIFGSLSEFFAARRQAKLPEKMFYSVLRSVKGNLTQAEVDAYQLALKSINKE